MPLNRQQTLPKTLPGVVRPQWVKCGRANCRCHRGHLHGPYNYRFWREGGRLRKQYVKRDKVTEVRAACDARQQQRRDRKAAMDDWRAILSIVKQAEKLCQN